jgi:hypothetical protein
MQERKLMMRLPPGQRFVISYDREGASLYGIATPGAWDADDFATATDAMVPTKAEMDVIWHRTPSPQPKPPRLSDRLRKRRDQP